jgi:hypothetical protein
VAAGYEGPCSQGAVADQRSRWTHRATLTDIDTGQIRRKPILGGLINEYTHAA